MTDETSIAKSIPNWTPAYENPLKNPSEESPVARSYALQRESFGLQISIQDTERRALWGARAKCHAQSLLFAVHAHRGP